MFSRKRILLILSLFVAVMIAVVCYLLFTTSGSTAVTKLAMSHYAKIEDIEIKNIEGNLSNQMNWKGLIIKDAEWLPKGSVLTIAELKIDLNLLKFKNIYLKINNATLELPGIGKFIAYGEYLDNALNFNIYSKYINIDELLGVLSLDDKLKRFSGVVNDFDLYLKGSFANPQFSGEFIVNELRRDGFIAANCLGSFKLELKDVSRQAKLYGEIQVKSGKLSGNKTAIVILEPSFIFYSGDFKEPSLSCKGNSSVEGVKIDLKLKGTFNKPDLNLSSTPLMPKEKLLIMLATGRMWKGADILYQSGELPVGLAADFLDYFIFSGSGTKLAQKMGVKDFSINANSSSKGLGFKKELNSKVDVMYGVDQSNTKDSKSPAMQKIGLGYKITDNISIDAERGINQNGKNDNENEKSKEDSKAKIQFKKEF